MSFLLCVEPQFSLDESDTITKTIVDKVMALPLEDRSWPTCLNRPVRNMGSAMINKSGKSIVKSESAAGGKGQPKSAAHRTRSKKVIPLAVAKPDDDVVHSLSSDTIESPKEEKMDVDAAIEKELEMSSSRIFAKGICRIFSFLTYSLLAVTLLIMLLSWTEHCFIIVEYKPPVIKPVMISARDLFAKRARDEKSTETDSSKSVMVLSPLTSPLGKKLKFQAPSAPRKSGSSLPLVAHGYAVDEKPSSFAHLLSDSLLPQSVEGHSSKSTTEILDNCAGQSFHVSILLLFHVDVYYCIFALIIATFVLVHCFRLCRVFSWHVSVFMNLK